MLMWKLSCSLDNWNLLIWNQVNESVVEFTLNLQLKSYSYVQVGWQIILHKFLSDNLYYIILRNKPSSKNCY